MTTPATDPVCGMQVRPSADSLRADFDGETYYFCAAGCRAKFTANPVAFLNPREADAPRDATYTCPMHPEILQQGPGSCPVCGMSLEPLVQSAEPEVDEELRDKTRRAMGSAIVDPQRCLSYLGRVCGFCHDACPFPQDAIKLTPPARPWVLDACVGCGRCVEECPQNPTAIDIRRMLT